MKWERVRINDYRTVEGYIICRNCQTVGHMARNCPHKKRDDWNQTHREASFQARQDARKDETGHNSNGSNNSNVREAQPHTSTQGQTR